jgi:16S rRNA (adenine1518-N6/adenine1519-N6)-dimethyltransferase
LKTIKAKKSLGQNFLIDQDILHTIADYFDVNWGHILEVGPGYGALTEYLIQKKPNSLHLVELDTDMVMILESRVWKKELKTQWIDFHIFHQDILKFQSTFEQYFVIANIPYYITSPILTHFLYDVPNTPQKMLILMQREVGERILEWQITNEKWKIKKTKSSVLSLMIAKKCFTEKVIPVPKMAFKPAPKVDSIVIAFESHDIFSHIDDNKFLDFIKICFKEPRKKLQNNLLKWGFQKEYIHISFEKLGLSEVVRAEELSVNEMIDLMELLTKIS